MVRVTPSTEETPMKQRILLAASLPVACGSALAQSAYPEKPIKLVEPYAPGDSADIAARLISDAWAKALGGAMYIENKDGFDPLPGTSAEARARLAKEIPMWSQLIKERGITAE